MYTKQTFIAALRDFTTFGLKLKRVKRFTKQEFDKLRNPIKVKI